jgi:hypothetical protein
LFTTRREIIFNILLKIFILKEINPTDYSLLLYWFYIKYTVK